MQRKANRRGFGEAQMMRDFAKSHLNPDITPDQVFCELMAFGILDVSRRAPNVSRAVFGGAWRWVKSQPVGF
ncbi:hypothetical protein NBRC3293_2484 [Gluconobacter oxydans NBRC 3293]|uniref:Uncharacterized protein n=1 Tax=Gluconobacter oxydans NBRC 3293 TaxID=1315969 RepID=A0A829X573_GLUOY|nr:hypothetical protein NBRC3293_2484 [Gluconobacter oxydans NBRC 3293]